MKRIFLFFLLFTIMTSTAMAGEPIQALIITGQNNHNWPVSHPILKEILENSGRFTVDVAISPKSGEDMSGFAPDFSNYQVVVLDYNGDRWPEQTEVHFLDYLNAGGGLVIYHAANNAFPDWYEYNRVIGLGGWGGRNEQSGPYLYWEDGRLVKDASPGRGGSHGKQTSYEVNTRDTEHPITQGLPLSWRHAMDELYDRMRGPGHIASLLGTAYSTEESGGSGREEPVIFTVDYGNARIFHTMLGHVEATAEESTAMQCTGFQVTLLRGAEWAATGEVTQPVPADFPTADEVSLRPDFKAPTNP